MEKASSLKVPLIFTAISAVVFVLLGIFGVLFFQKDISFEAKPEISFAKFSSEEEFREYLKNSALVYGVPSLSAPGGREALKNPTDVFLSPATSPLDRVSQTNIQVQGVDEPDIVKTNGKNIFFSPQNFFHQAGTTEWPTVERIYPPSFAEPNTKVISALPPENINLQGEIKEQGDLLLSGNVLLVLGYNKITAFDITDPVTPSQKWQHEYEEGYTYATARFTGGKAYVVAARHAYHGTPCPLPLLKSTLTIPCTDIYRPSRPITTDTLYTVLEFDSQSGKVENSVSFVGSSGESVIYMSENAIYLTSTTYPNPLEFMSNFVSQNPDLVDKNTAARINNLKSIDISSESKLNELGILIEKHLSSLSQDEQARVRNEFTNRMNDYLKKHGRELQVSSIVKIKRNGLSIEALGEVPGAPLNQFSLDEYNGDLRIATTLSAGTMFGQGESANDIYVLSADLSKKGQIQGLALGERIYSARFIKDKAYLVTFKEIDPFFVIDLSDENPRVAGELKIPGFSSYLHPLSNGQILGVGQENGQVKLSAFDVENPDNPIESSKYLLSDFFTEVQNNHRAFLEDSDNRVFFLPAGSTGYIFSYENGLSLKRAVTGVLAKRALYINNYLYIVGDDKIVVLDEANWEEVGNLSF